jgi:hypothetical protein
VRIRLLIDVETQDLPRLQKYVGEQPIVHLRFEDKPLDWVSIGRFVGAKEAMDGLDDPALKDPYDRQAEREQRK